MTLLRSLSIVKVIRYRSKQWNQTNYYSLDRDRLAEVIKIEIAEAGLALASQSVAEVSSVVAIGEGAPFGDASVTAQSTETVEMCNTSSQGEGYQTLEMRDSEISLLYESKNTNQKETAKQEGDHVANKLESIAAAPLKKALEGEKSQRGR